MSEYSMCSISQSGSGTVQPTMIETGFAVEFKGVDALPGAPETRELTVDFDASYGTICVIGVKCDYCSEFSACSSFDYASKAAEVVLYLTLLPLIKMVYLLNFYLFSTFLLWMSKAHFHMRLQSCMDVGVERPSATPMAHRQTHTN